MKEMILRFILLIAAVIGLLFVCIMLMNREDDGSLGDYNSADAMLTKVIETTVPYTETEPETETVTNIVIIEPPPEELTAHDVTEHVPDSTEANITTVSRTIITSRVRKEYDNNSVYIDMKNILQLPELPVGCEITALTTLLNYYGFDAEKTDMARNYLPKGTNFKSENGKTYKDSFFKYFIGDPFSRGYGCFSYAIEKAANSYISSHGGGYTVLNISGAHPDILYDYLAQGIPVLCWATDGMIEPEYYETWYDYETGEQLDWYLNEHCFVLAGFNMSGDTVTLNDPMKGIIDYNINKFETRYDQMHRQAIVIFKNAPDDEDVTEIVTDDPVDDVFNKESWDE